MMLKNCRLVPELSGGIGAECGSVLVENGRIERVFSDKDAHEMLEKMAGQEVFDCQKMTLLPGLIDAHTHIACLRGYDASQLKEPMDFLIRTCRSVRDYLKYGFTTIRDCGTPLRVANHVRNAIESGLFTGPRVIACGLILSPTEIETKDSLYELYSWCDSAEECRKAARRELAEHGDFVKVMASGSALHRQGVPEQPIIEEDELRELVRTARKKGSYVAAHAHGDSAVQLCIDSGVRTIEHASYISEETIAVLQLKKECFLVPTLSAFYQNPETTPTEYHFLIERLRQMRDRSAQCLKRAYEAGIVMGFGTDSTCGMEQYEHGIEFQYRRELCGMKDVDILLQATKYSAEMLGISGITGEIKAGLQADLILVDGRPDEDISAMYRRPERVWIGGIKV